MYPRQGYNSQNKALLGHCRHALTSILVRKVLFVSTNIPFETLAIVETTWFFQRS